MGAVNPSKLRMREALLKYCAQQVQAPTHAITVSFRQQAKNGTPLTRETCGSALRWLKIQSERKLFKRQVKRPECRIGFVAFVEGSRELQNLHAHILLQTPPNIPYQHVCDVLQGLATRHAWIRAPLFIEPWRSRHWDTYIVKFGINGLIVL